MQVAVQSTHTPPTPLFPLAEEPYRGKAIYTTVLALQRLADVEVYCPSAVYPPFLTPRYRYHRPDLSYRPEGVNYIRYLEYPVIPILTRPRNGSVWRPPAPALPREIPS